MYAEALRLAEYMDGKAVASVARDKATPDRTRKAILKPETVKELGLAQAFRKLVRRDRAGRRCYSAPSPPARPPAFSAGLRLS